jgi:hypothetical protein
MHELLKTSILLFCFSILILKVDAAISEIGINYKRCLSGFYESAVPLPSNFTLSRINSCEGINSSKRSLRSFNGISIKLFPLIKEPGLMLEVFRWEKI